MTIVEQLRPLAVPVDNLTTDPSNARRGDVGAVRRSLNVFGQRKPVVVKQTGSDAQGRPTGIVIAGNHTFLAAVELGWRELAAVFVKDDDTTARAYALADNRTGELATWDYEQLADSLHALDEAKFDLEALGWSEHELEGLLGASWQRPGTESDLERDYSNGAANKHTLTVGGDAWPLVQEALERARERQGDPGLTDEQALVAVCREYTAGD